VKPTATWVATTLHGDTGGFRSRRAFAS
jgi:hypothetical protein